MFVKAQRSIREFHSFLEKKKKYFHKLYECLFYREFLVVCIWQSQWVKREEKKKSSTIFFVPAINFCTEHRKKIDDDSVYTQNIHALKL